MKEFGFPRFPTIIITKPKLIFDSSILIEVNSWDLKRTLNWLTSQKAHIDGLIVSDNKKVLDHLKEIYPCQLTVEKANKPDHLAHHLDLSFMIDSGCKLSTKLYKNVMILTSPLPIFHSFPAKYHLAFLWCTQGVSKNVPNFKPFD